MLRPAIRKTWRRVVFGSIVALLCVGLSAQENPPFQTFQVKSGVPISFDIESTTQPRIIEAPSINWGSLQPDSVGLDAFVATYNPPVDYMGDITLVISYTGVNLFPVYTYTKTTEVTFQVNSSIIDVQDDFYKLEGTGPISIFPLDNDGTTDGPLILDKIAQTAYGETTIVEDNHISYSPNNEFNGRDFIRYVTKDEAGNKKAGSIYILSVDPLAATSDTIDMVVSSVTPAYVFMPVPGLELISQSRSIGIIESMHEMVYMYSPTADGFGSDQLIFESEDGYSRIVNITVIDNGDDNDIVRNDEVYTAIDSRVEFNILDNDLALYSSIIYFSPELEDLGGGNFAYTPEPGFRGFKNFTYRVSDGSKILSGNILIKVDDFQPDNFIYYQFSVDKNGVLVLDYEVPIDDYSFTIASPAKHGIIESFSTENVQVDCGVAQGKALIIYTPEEGYSGTDEFSLGYCTDAGNCNVVKVSVSVSAEESDDCVCVESCVWPGDANNDGIVSVSDILPIGFHMGATGTARPAGSSEWTPQEASDWNIQQDSGSDLKYIDADGDGYITVEDSIVLTQNLGKYSNLLPSTIHQSVRSPIYLVPRTTEVSAGDVMVLDIMVGTEAYPVLDMHGLSFNMRINEAFIDSSSLQCHFYEDSWLVDRFGMMGMVTQPSTGDIRTAITKTTGISVSGDGIIGTTIFIVEEEVDGFRLKDNKIDFEIYLENILAMDSEGNAYTLPTEPVSITLNLNKSDEEEDPEEDLGKDLVIFPNPASDLIQVYLNQGKKIQTIRITDPLGRMLYSKQNLDVSQESIDVSSFPGGLYLLEISDGHKLTTTQIKVAR